MKPIIVTLWILGWETLSFLKYKHAESLKKWNDNVLALACTFRSLSGFVFAYWLWKTL